MYYRVCECCGAALDPGELCDCRDDQIQMEVPTMSNTQSEETRTEQVPMLECTQPPVISENLMDLQERLLSIKETVQHLPAIPESVPKVKKARAELRKYFDTLEQQRKTVKAAVMEPYNKAESKYKTLVSGPINEADKLCKDFIDSVETSMKRACEAGLREYFEELRAVNHVEWLPFERCGVVVDLTSARQKTPKKLREQLASFVSQVSFDVGNIAEMENAEEIMVEYQKSLNVANAIGTVLERHRRIQAQREAAEARAAAKAAEAAAVQKVEAVAPPEPVHDPVTEKRYKITFTLHPTETQLEKLRPVLRNLKEFLKQEEIDYE